jgi:hypothetical protein
MCCGIRDIWGKRWKKRRKDENVEARENGSGGREKIKTEEEQA